MSGLSYLMTPSLLEELEWSVQNASKLGRIQKDRIVA